MAKVTLAVDTTSTFITKFNALDSDFRGQGLTRESISVNDISGYGSLTYTSSTGVIAYTGPSDSDIRGTFSAGTGITIDSSGEIAASVTVVDASISVKGIAQFDSADFSVTSGFVSITPKTIQTTDIAADAVTRAKLADEVEFIIYNSSGTPVKTLYGAGS